MFQPHQAIFSSTPGTAQTTSTQHTVARDGRTILICVLHEIPTENSNTNRSQNIYKISQSIGNLYIRKEILPIVKGSICKYYCCKLMYTKQSPL
jgi:hypothetical protein